MTKELENSVKELIERAKKEGIKSKGFSTRSSLHSLIKTREQAERFMLLLEHAMNKKAPE